MPTPLSDLPDLLRALDPLLHDGVYVYARVPETAPLPGLRPLATFREEEGLTLIVPESEALEARLPILFRADWITLRVPSDLAALGLTAAVAGALSAAGISCNMVAAACHDHVFVPAGEGPRALAALRALQGA